MLRFKVFVENFPAVDERAVIVWIEYELVFTAKFAAVNQAVSINIIDIDRSPAGRAIGEFLVALSAINAHRACGNAIKTMTRQSIAGYTLVVIVAADPFAVAVVISIVIAATESRQQRN